MKTLFVALMTTLSFTVSAEVFNCRFTEPFMSVEYNTVTKKLLETNLPTDEQRIIQDVSFLTKESGTVLLTDKSGAPVAELALTNEGSDGMSDAIYPYEAKYFNATGEVGFTLHGGCTSTSRPLIRDAE